MGLDTEDLRGGLLPVVRPNHNKK